MSIVTSTSIKEFYNEKSRSLFPNEDQYTNLSKLYNYEMFNLDPLDYFLFVVATLDLIDIY